MKIGLIDVDSHNFPNLALMKISAWHKEQGDHVEWWDGFAHYDRVYMSKVFTTEYSPDVLEPVNADEIVKGGTGYDLKNKLPDYIENMCPDYNLYPQFSEAYGFLTRGCPRGCKFCIVAEKEGKCSKQVADLDCFYRGQKEIKLCDPNLLACKDHEKLLQQLSQSGAWVDFTQGLDIRLTNRDNVALLNNIKTKMLHFAWDNPDQDLTAYFKRFNELTTCKDYRKKCVYVLTNFGSTHEQDLYRIYTLREMGYDPYVMIYNKSTAPRITRRLQRWCNSKFIFRAEPDFAKYK
ncbi:conserved protein of unknown function [Ruminococcaceae bacterium BL-6]|nr:conserved protein of unknown function [Ruminococcaceae bacterium BL-6]